MEADHINRIIGERIKNLRVKMGLTQQELADRTELTKGYISQLEHGLVAPSIVTLFDLIECLGTTAEEFFKRTEDVPIVYTDEGYFEKIDDAGNSIQWIVPTAQKNLMEPLLVTLRPHSRLDEIQPHEGEEFGFVISGRIRVHYGEKQYIVKTGETFYFPADRAHFIENRTANPAKFIYVSSPPSF